MCEWMRPTDLNLHFYRLARDQKREDLERAEKSQSNVTLNRRTLGEGDLFGVRAIQSGFYGGVSQISLTPPTSSASSTRSTPMGGSLDGNGSPDGSLKDSSPHKPSSSASLSKSGTRKPPPAPINSRLQPSDAELNGRMNHDPTIHGRVRSYTPTSPRSPRSPHSPMSFDSGATEIPRSPALDAQRQKLASLLEGKQNDGRGPQLILPSELQRTPDFVSTPNNPAASIKSAAASVSTLDLPARPDLSTLKSPTLSLFPNNAPRRELLPILPPRQSSRDNRPHDIPAVPHSLRVPPAPLSPSTPALQLRATSGVSIWGDGLIQDLAAQKRNTQLSNMSVRLPSGYPSSVSSSGIHPDDPTSSDETTRSRRRSRSLYHNGHTRQSSGESASSSRERGIKHTHDSIRHTRKQSADSIATTAASKTSRRRSAQRDAMHYDPSGHRRAPSGSILARRPVDFDHPRSSPFSPFDDQFAISVSPPTDDVPQSRKPVARSGGSRLEQEINLSPAEELTLIPASRVVEESRAHPRKLVKERSQSVGRKSVGSGQGKKKRTATPVSRSEVMEAYYHAARLSRSYEANNADTSTSESSRENAATAVAGASRPQERRGEGMARDGRERTAEGAANIRSRIPLPASKPLEVSKIESAFTAGGYRRIRE